MKKRLLFALSLLLTLTLLAGCSKSASDSGGFYDGNSTASSYSKTESASQDAYGLKDVASAGDTPMATNPENKTDSPASGRKLIKRVGMTIETLEFDNSISAIESAVSNLGGYIETSTVNNSEFNAYNGYSYGSHNRSAYYTLRIPGEMLDTFLNSVSNIGNVISQNTQTEDITLTYIDLEARTESLEIQQERLLALLEKAETVEDIISLEERLSTVRYQIEAQKSQLKNYDNLVSYSTVTITLNEVVRITYAEPETVGERISSGLSDTFYDLGEAFKDFAVWFVVNLPYIIIWGIIIALAIFIIIKIANRRNRKKALLAAQAQAAWASQHTAQGYGSAPQTAVQPQPGTVDTSDADKKTE